MRYWFIVLLFTSSLQAMKRQTLDCNSVLAEIATRNSFRNEPWKLSQEEVRKLLVITQHSQSLAKRIEALTVLRNFAWSVFQGHYSDEEVSLGYAILRGLETRGPHYESDRTHTDFIALLDEISFGMNHMKAMHRAEKTNSYNPNGVFMDDMYFDYSTGRGFTNGFGGSDLD